MAHAALRNGSLERQKSSLVAVGSGAVWLIGLSAGLQVVRLLLGKSPLAAALAGAVLADFVSGFAGVRWDSRAPPPKRKGAGAESPASNTTGVDGSAGPESTAATTIEQDGPAEPESTAANTNETRAVAEPAAAQDQGPSPARRVAYGMAAALGVMFVTVVAAAVAGGARVEAGQPGTTLAFAMLRSAAMGVRDELLFRGIVLTTAARARVPASIGAAFAALAGAAPVAFMPDITLSGIALAIASGWLFAVLWLRYEGAWAAVGAHAFWVFLVGSGVRGGVLDVTFTHGTLGPAGHSSGAAAWIAAAVFALFTVIAIRYKSLPGATGAADRASGAGAAR